MSVSSKSSIVQKTTQVGTSTLLSKVLGIIREVLQANYLGIGADAFITAFKIPNSLRKIFAEGALSAAFVPSLVQIVRAQGKDQASKLMSLAFLIFESVVLAICFIAMWQAKAVISFIAPGFSDERVALAVPLLRILMPFIFFISSSSLLAGALQAVNHFFVPAFSQVLLNIFYIGGLIVCLWWNFDPTYLCFFILAGGFVQCLAHVAAYLRLHFSFGSIDRQAWRNFGGVLSKFLLGSISMSIAEINLFIGTSFASYLPDGSISLMFYANRFMGIPLSVFSTSFSTVLLPHLSHISSYAPKRLGFYVLEATKLIFWVTIPATIMMIFFSEKVFSTLFLSNKFTHANVTTATHILIAYALGLFFISINKILLNIYYALHNTWLPAVVSALAVTIDVLLSWLLMESLQAVGLALAATVSAVVQMILFTLLLRMKFAFPFYGRHLLLFCGRFIVQLIPTMIIALGIYYGGYWCIETALPPPIATFMLTGFGFWLWTGPLCCMLFVALWYTRKLFNIRLYFID